MFRNVSFNCCAYLLRRKLTEKAVATTIATHISDYNLGHPHQWAYKKGHSTELLLVKMIEDWRRALDKNLIVGIAFVDFRKAFDSISHHDLLEKLQAVGGVGDLLCWIKDYLADPSQVTVVNGFCFGTYPDFVVL